MEFGGIEVPEPAEPYARDGRMMSRATVPTGKTANASSQREMTCPAPSVNKNGVT